MLTILLIVMSFSISACKSDTEVAFDEFLNTPHKESYIVVPLCIAGESVVPVVTEKIKSKKMERRTYAIGFLGTTESKSSISVLQKILMDETEMIGYRAGSLESIYLLDEKLGQELALKYQNRNDYLGETANEVMAIENYVVHKKQYKEMICHPTD